MAHPISRPIGAISATGRNLSGLIINRSSRKIYPATSPHQSSRYSCLSGTFRPRIFSPSTRKKLNHNHHRRFSSSTMAPIPSSMKAVQIDKTGGPDVLQYRDVPVPKLQDGQILVRNDFTGVNFIDTYFRTGLYKADLPLTIGREAAGEVVAAQGSAASSVATVGAKVVYMASGTYAEYTVVPAKDVVVIPNGVSTEQAAAVFLQGLTAWCLIRESANVQAGQWTLVHAAAGGVGLLLVQMLKSVGAKVIGTASTNEKCELAKKNGAGWTINSKDEDVVARVKDITGGHGIDAIFDGIGAATFDADLDIIAMKGHLVSFGNASGAVPPLSILRLGPKNVSLLRPVLNGYVAQREDLVARSNELFEMVAAKKINIAVHDVYPLKEAARAHVDIESRKTTGKLLIKTE